MSTPDLDVPPELGQLVAALSPAQDAAARALPEQVEAWLRERTADWPASRLRLLRDRLAGEVAGERRAAYRTDPLLWAREVCHVELWSLQRAIFQLVMANRRVAVPSCHGAGKTFTAAVLAAWWLSVHEPGTAFVVSTAPTFAQVRAVLWREITRLHRAADLPGYVNQTEWHSDEGELIGFGRKPADTDEHAFQGIHAPRVLVLIDEAGGVPEQLWTAAEAVAVGEDDRIVAFGNPDDPASHFARVTEMPALWAVQRISAFDTPNLTGETMPAGVPPGMVTRRWVEDRRVEWTEDSPLWQSKVLGHFPDVDEFGTIRPGDLAACRLGVEVEPVNLVELGVDVGGGTDRTSIRARHGMRAGRKWEARTPEPQDVVDLIVAAVLETPGVQAVKLDSTGIGWGVVSDLRKTLAQRGLGSVRVVGVNFAERASDPTVYANRRAELWWTGRLLSQRRQWDLRALDDDTAGQLLAPRWSKDTKDRILIEKKDDVIARLGRSPDDADALLLAFAPSPVRAAEVTVPTMPIPTGAAAASR